jgi:hypothetical protein
MRLFRRKPRRTFGPQPGKYDGCVGCSRWAASVERTCSVEDCELEANTAILLYFCPTPGIGSRSWFYLCQEHGDIQAKALITNVGGNGPFDQDIRLRLFTEASHA